MRIVNGGATLLRFFLSEEKGVTPLTGLSVAPGEDITTSAASLGTGPYLGVKNENTDAAGAFELVLL